MVPKRPFSDKESDAGSDVPRSQDSKRRNSFATIVRDAIREDSLREFVTQLEPFLRTVVREEVESAVERVLVRLYPSSSRTSLNQSESSQARVWQLHFVDKLPSTLFTGSRIESEDRNSITIVILDSVSKQVISSGPFSSLKVQIVVLDGDFGADDKEDWTEEEFNANLVREREGKRPLVTGDLMITLRAGIGSVGDVSFTDNSSWIRSRKFRLGARPVQSTSTERIREARSEAFVVKDHRGELYKKHHPPKWNDEIWRLDKIAKGGTYEKALAGNRITTVKDFLRSYYIDPSFLRHVLVGISNKTWQTIIQHATACILDDELYAYYKDGESIGIVFNSVYKVEAVTFDGGQSYQSLDVLNEFQMGLVENLKRHAFKNLNALVPLDVPPAIGPAMLASSSLLADPFTSSSSNLQDANFPGMHQDQMEMELASSQMTMTTSPPCSYNPQFDSQPEVSVTRLSYPMQLFSPTLLNSYKADSYGGPYDIGKSWAPVMQITHLTADDNSQVGTSIWQGDGFFFAPTDNAVGIAASNFGIPISRNGKPKARWCMIRAAVKWGISVRRDAAAKRMARFLSQLL